MEKKVLNEMFENLLHIGNKTNFWNSKMRDYIYGSVNWVHVINLLKTWIKLEEVKNELKTFATEGKKILFVATKLQARDSFSKVASDTGHFYVTEKWVPGLLTNFKTIKARIVTYLKLLRDSETWAVDVLTKKEKAAKMLELEKLDRAFRWLKEMKKTPDVIFVVDSIYEKQAVKEANNLKIPVFAIANTNGDDSIVTNLIPANTNSVKSIDYLANELAKVLTWMVIKQARTQKTVVKKPMVKKTTETKVIRKEEAPKKVITTKKTEEKVEKVEEKIEVKKEETPKKVEVKTEVKKEETSKKVEVKTEVKKEETPKKVESTKKTEEK